MSKKGRIITWVIIGLLIIAVGVVLVTQLMNGGARKITRTEFEQYIENAQYFDEEHNPNVVDGEIRSKLDDTVLEGYKVKDGKIVTADDKESARSEERRVGKECP